MHTFPWKILFYRKLYLRAKNLHMNYFDTVTYILSFSAILVFIYVNAHYTLKFKTNFYLSAIIL